jgi:orotidine-5'-phosphate decarboxylase
LAKRQDILTKQLESDDSRRRDALLLRLLTTSPSPRPKRERANKSQPNDAENKKIAIAHPHSAALPAKKRWLSQKPIDGSERLIFALDTPDIQEAKRLVNELGDQVHFYKLGLELFVAGGYFELVEWLSERGKKSFVDLKFFDVPQTVASAVRQLRGKNASFVTVHGNDEITKAACDEKDGVKILAVTVLTSLNQADIEEFGYKDVSILDLVLSRAKRALNVGCDGVISSGLEAEALREQLGERFLIVVPGIRPVANVDDQKRTVDVEAAFENGADYIVIGRPIRDAPNRVAAARAIQRRIQRIFSS